MIHADSKPSWRQGRRAGRDVPAAPVRGRHPLMAVRPVLALPDPVPAAPVGRGRHRRRQRPRPGRRPARHDAVPAGVRRAGRAPDRRRPPGLRHRRHRSPQGPVVRRRAGVVRSRAGLGCRPGQWPGRAASASPTSPATWPAPPRSSCGAIGVDGAERVVEADAFEARALLHELDHLDGFLFLDRVAVGPCGVPPQGLPVDSSAPWPSRRST